MGHDNQQKEGGSDQAGLHMNDDHRHHGEGDECDEEQPGSIPTPPDMVGSTPRAEPDGASIFR
jgi:hypothetical protein